MSLSQMRRTETKVSFFEPSNNPSDVLRQFEWYCNAAAAGEALLRLVESLLNSAVTKRAGPGRGLLWLNRETGAQHIFHLNFTPRGGEWKSSVPRDASKPAHMLVAEADLSTCHLTLRNPKELQDAPIFLIVRIILVETFVGLGWAVIDS